MKRFKVYTSKGIYTVDNVTCSLNAMGIIKRNFGNSVEIYDTKEIDDYEYAEDVDDYINNILLIFMRCYMRRTSVVAVQTHHNTFSLRLISHALHR